MCVYICVCVCLIHSDKTLNANIPMVTNHLNSNHENEKPEAELPHQISTTEEALYMTSNIGNKKLQQPLKSAPQKVRYVRMYITVYVHTVCIHLDNL